MLGVGIAYVAFRRAAGLPSGAGSVAGGLALQHFWETDWGFDWLYDRTLVRPFLWVARSDQGRCHRQLLQRPGCR